MSARSPAVAAASDAPQLSWVLPMYRTAEQLDELLARIHAVSAMVVATHEVILVDDACPTGSGARAEAAAAVDPRVRVLRLPVNQGQEAALHAGLRLSRGAWTLILDADLQDPPEALRALWAARPAAAAAVVFARRTGSYTSPGRHLTSRLYRAAIRWVGGLPAGACLFALLSRAMVDRIAQVDGRHASLLAIIASASDAVCASVPIVRARRQQGESAYGTLARCAMAARSLWQMVAARWGPVRRIGAATARRTP